VLRLTPWLITASLVGCKACIGCVDPDMPSDPSDPVIGETDPPEDTAETAPPIDTAPPPPCDVPETEPNDDRADADEMPLEQTACGGFTTDDDGEWLVFPAEDAAWIRVAVRAAAMGSAADVAFAIVSPEHFDVTVVTPTMYWEDPWILFPALGDEQYYLYLSERSGQWGDDHEWEIMASEDKEPVAWTVREVEDNDIAARGQTVAPGDVILGTIDSASDYDWFHISVPDPGEGEKIAWDFQVEAYTSGSPLASRLTLYDSDIVGGDVDDVDFLATSFADADAYDRDPHIEIQSEGAADWYLLIKNPSTDGDDGGSAFHWYTITIDNDQD
jgi:hypothetical protein